MVDVDMRNNSDPILVYNPGVFVVAKTQFLGIPGIRFIPEDVRNIRASMSGGDLRRAITAKNQDRGTDAERLIEFAGRGCYDSYGRGRSSADFHANIKAVRHGSVLEHCSWTFWIEGVSRGLTHELVRHRVGVAISQRSTRYTDESKSRIIVPPIFIVKEGDDESSSQVKVDAQNTLLRTHRAAAQAYSELVSSGAHLMDLRDGVSKTGGRKMARGAARSTLGQDLEACLTWTVNLRSLINAACQRYNEHAEAEIRRLFRILIETVKPDVPNYLEEIQEIACSDGLGNAADPDTLWVL